MIESLPKWLGLILTAGGVTVAVSGWLWRLSGLQNMHGTRIDRMESVVEKLSDENQTMKDRMHTHELEQAEHRADLRVVKETTRSVETKLDRLLMQFTNN